MKTVFTSTAKKSLIEAVADFASALIVNGHETVVITKSDLESVRDCDAIVFAKGKTVSAEKAAELIMNKAVDTVIVSTHGANLTGVNYGLNEKLAEKQGIEPWNVTFDGFWSPVAGCVPSKSEKGFWGQKAQEKLYETVSTILHL